MTKMTVLMVTGSALIASVASATPTSPGTPLTVSSGSLSANGNVKAVFLYVAAADTSNLDFVGGVANPIFINKGPGANSPGDTVNLGTQSGTIEFTLNNLTAGTSYTNDLADLDGNYHAFYSTNAITTNAATNDYQRKLSHRRRSMRSRRLRAKSPSSGSRTATRVGLPTIRDSRATGTITT